MKYDLIIRNGFIVRETGTIRADLGITGEKIADLKAGLESIPPCGEIDATDRYVMPGGIDVHVHLQLPVGGMVSSDDFVTGTKAAAAGGVTTVIDFADQDPEKGLMKGIENRMKQAEGRASVDFSFHSAITNWNDSLKDEMKDVIAFGIPSFKMYMIYASKGMQSDDADLFSALETTVQNRARIMVHAESDKVMNLLINRLLPRKEELGAWAHALSRPNFIEAEAVQRAVTWTEATGGRLYIVHMSTGEAVDILHAARERGVDVLAETCPQYLLLNEELFKDRARGHLFATCPQLKKKKDQKRLWKGLAGGDLSIVSTDTCTFTAKQKESWGGDFTKIPYGLPGVETLVPALFTFGVLKKKIDVNRFVSLISTNPARIMGLYPEKGCLAPGSDADLIIVDPKKKRTIDYRDMETNCDWSPYQGMDMAGFPDLTMCRGKIVAREGRFTGEEGYGRFVPRKILTG